MREDGGIIVRLFWDRGADQVILRYQDRQSGEAFDTQVPKSEALQAFEHPNAYRPAQPSVV